MASLIHRDTVPGLTGLRFVAAFCVLIAHSVTVLMGGHEVYWIKQASGFGMTLFFVLSGFVIHYNYAVAVTGSQARSRNGRILLGALRAALSAFAADACTLCSCQQQTFRILDRPSRAIYRRSSRVTLFLTVDSKLVLLSRLTTLR